MFWSHLCSLAGTWQPEPGYNDTSAGPHHMLIICHGVVWYGRYGMVWYGIVWYCQYCTILWYSMEHDDDMHLSPAVKIMYGTLIHEAPL